MSIISWTIIVIIFAIAIYIFINGISQLISVIFGCQYVKSPNKVIEEAVKLANLKNGDIFYDLGCGSGRIIKAVSDNFNIEAYGVEIAPIPFIKANILCIDNKNTHIKFVNLLKTNLNKADAIFCYLRPSLMKKLESKFKCELKRGARVIVHSFPLPNLEPKKVVKIQKHTLYLYQF